MLNFLLPKDVDLLGHVDYGCGFHLLALRSVALQDHWAIG